MVDVMYNRQEALQDVRPPDEVSIVGCGGVGAWAGINLALAGVERINLFDEDKIELHNLNRVPFRPEDVGKQKTEVLKKFIKKIRPAATVYVRGKVTKISQTLLSGVIVDCTDKLEVQQLIYDACKTRKMPYYRIGYDGHHLTVIDGQHKEAPKLDKVWSDGSGQTGYTTVPSWVVPPVVAAALVTEMICVNQAHGDPSPPINVLLGDLLDINVYIEMASGRSKTKGKKKEKGLDSLFGRYYISLEV